MNNFKSGSGDLDFGETTDGSEEENGPDEGADTAGDRETSQRSPPADGERQTGRQSPRTSDENSSEPGSRRSTREHEYPYFVRRSNVGDERDVRIELHVREFVKANERSWLTELADKLDTDEVPKTDAREYAMIVAQENPDLIAEKMQDDGYGTVN